MSTTSIPRIAIVGGPSGGKTGVMSYLRQKLGDLGFTVIVVPEVATDIINSGMHPGLMEREDFQTGILHHTIERENRWIEMAMKMRGEKKVILCDRGIMDARAYMQDLQFDQLLAATGLTTVDLRDRRYDAAIFLRSPAVDKPEVYTRDNNTARLETPEEAAQLDRRTLAAWTGQPHFREIDNSTDFDGKKRRALEAVCRVLGIPAPLEIERKFRVKRLEMGSMPTPCVRVEIVQYYLKHEDPEAIERIRSRSQDGGVMYYHTVKREIRPGVRTEIERPITVAEYNDLLRRADPKFGRIKKSRYCFVYESQYFELDVFEKPTGLILLEIELTNEDDTIKHPACFTDNIEDVTQDPNYSNYMIARDVAEAETF